MDKRHKLRLTLVVNMEEPVSNVRSGPNRTCQLKHSLGATIECERSESLRSLTE